jgi:hypothetical protein
LVAVAVKETKAITTRLARGAGRQKMNLLVLLKDATTTKYGTYRGIREIR